MSYIMDFYIIYEHIFNILNEYYSQYCDGYEIMNNDNNNNNNELIKAGVKLGSEKIGIPSK